EARRSSRAARAPTSYIPPMTPPPASASPYRGRGDRFLHKPMARCTICICSFEKQERCHASPRRNQPERFIDGVSSPGRTVGVPDEFLPGSRKSGRALVCQVEQPLRLGYNCGRLRDSSRRGPPGSAGPAQVVAGTPPDWLSPDPDYLL